MHVCVSVYVSTCVSLLWPFKGVFFPPQLMTCSRDENSEELKKPLFTVQLFLIDAFALLSWGSYARTVCTIVNLELIHRMKTLNEN